MIPQIERVTVRERIPDGKMFLIHFSVDQCDPSGVRPYSSFGIKIMIAVAKRL